MGKDDLSDCIEGSKEGIYLDVSVSPDSQKTEITGMNPWRDQLEVSVMERARDGRANKALVDFFSELFEISTKDVKIVKGKTTKNKRLYFLSLGKDRLLEKIERKISK